MVTASNIRLPGVYFLPSLRAKGLGLPPLDVAAFVGFAERGPLHTPVAVEDFNAYRAIFGGDLELAHDLGGRTIYAHLPTAVSSFFSNGGRRCYVVRVAGRQATTTRFRLPGMVAFNGSQTSVSLLAQVAPQPVFIHASSEGRWSGRLRLGARLQATPLPVTEERFIVFGPQQLSWRTDSAPETVQKGDVLRLTFDDGRQWLFPVATVEQISGAGSVRRLLLTTLQVWQLSLEAATSPPRLVQQVRRLTFGGAESLQINGELSAVKESPTSSTQKVIEMALSGTQANQVKRGDLLQLNLSDNSTCLFPVTDIRQSNAIGSPHHPQLIIRANSMLKLPGEPLPLGSTLSLRRVERLRFDLLLRDGKERHPTLSELAFNAGHERFWGVVVLLEKNTHYNK